MRLRWGYGFGLWFFDDYVKVVRGIYGLLVSFVFEFVVKVEV